MSYSAYLRKLRDRPVPKEGVKDASKDKEQSSVTLHLPVGVVGRRVGREQRGE